MTPDNVAMPPAARPERNSFTPRHPSDPCPRCEEAILISRRIPHDLPFHGSSVPISGVLVEQCPACGYRELSGREADLFDLLLAPQYALVSDLVVALKAAGYQNLFLREDDSQGALGFNDRDYVASLPDQVRYLYLDNESAYVIDNLSGLALGGASLQLAGAAYTVSLPKLGEGENGIVYEYKENTAAVLKLAKPRPYSRQHLISEHEVTDFFQRQGVPVPRVLMSDSYGRFMLKQKLAGDSLSRTYLRVRPEQAAFRELRAAVKSFIAGLLQLFREQPAAKTSISPNNIFVLRSGNRWECLLVDTGPAPCHNYSDFDFDHYWDLVVPRKIAQYKTLGYL